MIKAITLLALGVAVLSLSACANRRCASVTTQTTTSSTYAK